MEELKYTNEDERAKLVKNKLIKNVTKVKNFASKLLNTNLNIKYINIIYIFFFNLEVVSFAKKKSPSRILKKT